MRLKHKVLGTVELREPYPGVFLDDENRYHPEATPNGIWVNPPGPRFGQVTTGDVLIFILRAFLGSNAEPFSTNIMHFILTKASGSKTFAAAATGMAKYIFSEIATDGKLSGEYSKNVTFKNPVIRSLNTSTDELETANSTPGTAASSTGSVPLRSSVVMHKGTAKSGRSFSGRTYLPACDETQQSAGSLTSASLSGFGNFAKAIRAFDDPDDSGTSFQLGVYSPSQTKKTGANVVTPVTSLAVRGVMGSQRRRQHLA